MGSLYRKSDAARAGGSPGRKAAASYRGPWRRDYARVIHSASFRRLQGKTQLFYGNDSVFRNRLTHSLEVAQIAKTIAMKLNADAKLELILDIPEIAGLAHDLGHPPFGHNGEKALDDCMKNFGGFEGNAQTLRILGRLEKRRREDTPNAHRFSEDGKDVRFGMDLTFRTLASVIKYDSEIPLKRNPKSPVAKGYYHTEQDLVKQIKSAVVAPGYSGPLKTIECSIMDVADDIAYSTYDLEDAWKSGFLAPLDLVSLPEDRLTAITTKVNRVERLAHVTGKEVLDALYEIIQVNLVPRIEGLLGDMDKSDPEAMLLFSALAARSAESLAKSGYYRTAFTSDLVERFMDGVRIAPDKRHPQLSVVDFEYDTLLLVECLKQYTYVSVIESPRLRIPEFRGYDVVKTIFDAICDVDKAGFSLMPEDFRDTYLSLPDKASAQRRRLVCDFIAGMTDTYAVDFYNRLNSDYPTTIFGPGL